MKNRVSRCRLRFEYIWRLQRILGTAKNRLRNQQITRQDDERRLDPTRPISRMRIEKSSLHHRLPFNYARAYPCLHANPRVLQHFFVTHSRDLSSDERDCSHSIRSPQLLLEGQKRDEAKVMSPSVTRTTLSSLS